MKAKLSKALGELREGIEAARRVVLERTEMRVDDNGQFRSAHELEPRAKLTVVPPKASGAAANGGTETSS